VADSVEKSHAMATNAFGSRRSDAAQQNSPTVPASAIPERSDPRRVPATVQNSFGLLLTPMLSGRRSMTVSEAYGAIVIADFIGTLVDAPVESPRAYRLEGGRWQRSADILRRLRLNDPF
jgi:hypothetical protein